MLKQLGPELKYIKDENNVVDDNISCFEMSDNQDILNIYQNYGYYDKDLPYSANPICYHDIVKAQKTDDELQKSLSHIKTIPSTPFGEAIKTIV